MTTIQFTFIVGESTKMSEIRVVEPLGLAELYRGFKIIWII